MSKLFASLVAALLAFVLLVFWVGGAQAQSVRFTVSPGEEISFRCQDGVFDPPTRGRVVAWRCKSTDTLPPEPGPEPTPPPSTGCGNPAGNSRPLKPGQEVPIRLSMSPVNRHFCSNSYPRGTDISWGPYSASSFSALTVILSTHPNNTEPHSVDRNCFRGGANDRMIVRPKSNCQIAPNTLYYLSITAKHPSTGKPTSGGRGELVLFNAKK